MFENLLNAIFAHISGSGLSPVYWPNISSSVPTGNHYRVDILPAATQSIGINNLDRNTGIIQITVYTQDGIGSIIPSRMVDSALSAVPRFTSIPSDSGEIRFDASGSVAPAVTANGWYSVPISFEYSLIT